MNATITYEAAQHLPSITTPARAPGATFGAPRVLLRLEGAAALVAACVAYASLGGSWGWFAALFLVPDLAMLGYLVNRRFGAALYNAAHTYLGAATLAALGATFGVRTLLFGALIWAAHVGFDRFAGYGLKYGTSFHHTHLGCREGAESR